MTWLDELEIEAQQILPDFVYGYYAMTAGTGQTHTDGIRDWAAARIRPRVLSGKVDATTATSVLGQSVETPVLVAPFAQAMAAHPDGEAAVGAGASSSGSLIGVSTNTAIGFDQVQAAGAPWWFQVYVMKDRGLTAALAQRARDAGATALMLTVDLPTLGDRRPHLEPANWPDPLLSKRGNDIDELVAFAGADRATADDLGPDTIGWLRDAVGLPVVVKGVLRADDAMIAAAAGAAAVLVSTHGGRALDRSISSAAALPSVAEALTGTAVEVYADSGLRSGADVFVALALGARAVFLGRPVLWGLSTAGSAGVQAVLDRVTAELRLVMQFCGIAEISEITREALG